MNDSILTSIKKLLGIESTYTHFDTDLIIHINSVFGILKQLGVKSTSYSIQDATATWSDYFGSNTDLEMIKTYVWARVRSAFDPPTSSAVQTSLDNIIKEFEWRINVEVDPGPEE